MIRKQQRAMWSKKNGITPQEQFKKADKLRLLDEDDLARHYDYYQLEKIRTTIDMKLSNQFFKDFPKKKFYSLDVAFKTKNASPNFDVLLHERRKVQGAMNKRTMRSMGGN